MASSSAAYAAFNKRAADHQAEAPALKKQAAGGEFDIFKDNGIWIKVEAAVDDILERMTSELVEPSIALKQKMVKLIFDLKTDLSGVKRRRKQLRERVTSLNEQCSKDTELLFKGELSPQNAACSYADKRIFDVKIPQHLKRVLKTQRTRNICLIHRLIEEFDYPDKDLALDIGNGFPSIGKQKGTGVWEHDPVRGEPKNPNPDEFLDGKIKLDEKKPSWMVDEVIEKVLALIVEDIEKGRFDEIDEADLKVNPLKAFGIVQKGKIRQLIDARVRNVFNSHPERVKLKGVRCIIEVLNAFLAPTGDEATALKFPTSQSRKDAYKRIKARVDKRKSEPEQKFKNGKSKLKSWDQVSSFASTASGEFNRHAKAVNTPAQGEGCAPAMGSRDYEKAYFQVGIADPETNAVKAYDLNAGKFRYFLSNVLDMGNNLSVPNWCRVAEFMMGMMASVALAPCLTYIDDSAVISVEEDLEEALQSFDFLSEKIGLVLSPKPESNQNSNVTERIEHLGLEWIFFENDMYEFNVIIEVPEKKLERTRERIKKLLDEIRDKNLRYKSVAEVLGDFNYIAGASRDKAGIQVLRPLYPLLNEDTFRKAVRQREARAVMTRTCRNILTMLEAYTPTLLSKELARRKSVWLYTDASSDGGSHGGPSIAAVLIDEHGEMHVTSMDVHTNSDLRIDFFEAMAVNLAVVTFKDLLQHKYINLAVDNLVDVYAFIKASHCCAKTSDQITEVILRLRAIDANFFIDYVVSEKNIADWLTRCDLNHLIDAFPRVNRRDAVVPAPFLSKQLKLGKCPDIP